jgi:RNA polymerase sigma-70 factor (ECF subfamily)
VKAVNQDRSQMPDNVPDGFTRVAEGASSTDLTSFVAEHYARLIRLAALVTHSVDEAEDAVQAALERAWRNRGTLNDQSRLRPWLDRIVVREAARTAHARRARIRPLQIPAAFETNPGDDRAALRTAFAALSVDHRATVVLHLYQGYSVPQTAEILGVPVETVRSRLRVARDRLRQLLADEG